MYNWSTDEKRFKKENPKEYKLWRLTQLINYGLDGEKLDRDEVKRAWPKIKDRLDPDMCKALKFYLWKTSWRPEPGLLPGRSNFWMWYFKRHTSSKNFI